MTEPIPATDLRSYIWCSPTTSILVAIVEKERRKEKNKRQKHRQAPTESIYILVPAQDPFPDHSDFGSLQEF